MISSAPQQDFFATRSRELPTHLARLEIKNLATISQLCLELGVGFCVFTGETGAGKSIIVDALSLLSGVRANTDLIRHGEAELLISGFWNSAHTTQHATADTATVDTAETDETDEEVIVSRRVTTQGRSTARLDGEVVSLREVQARMGHLLTIHGQHSSIALLSAAKQRQFLDRRTGDMLQRYSQAYQTWHKAQHRLTNLQDGQRERARQLDLLRFQISEIEAVAPQENEEDTLKSELTRLSNLHTIAQSAANALELLDEGEVNATGLLTEAVRNLNAGSKYDETSAQLQSELRENLSNLQAVIGELRVTAENSAPDTEELTRLEERLADLSKLKYKYGPEIADVLRYAEQAVTELAQLETDEQDLGTLVEETEELWQAVQVAGQALDQARRQAAEPLAAELEHVIQQLGMPHAQLEFVLRPLEQPATYGLSEVSILFNANPGEQLAPLADAASGGELSRVMLALSTVLGTTTPAVVFDEVDAGIGGAAAHAVATQLETLAQHKQVLAVTHLAQIAAKADHHYKVEKEVVDGRTMSRVRLLSPEERLHEIARMLSGVSSEAALQHAHELLSTR